MREILNKILYRRVTEKAKTPFKKYGIKLVKHIDTSLVLFCFGIIPSKKRGLVDIADENGNILVSGIKKSEADLYMNKFQKAAEIRYPDLSKGKALSKYLDDLLGSNRALKRARAKFKNPDNIHKENNLRTKPEIQKLKNEYYEFFGKERVERAIKIAENVSGSKSKIKEVLVSVMSHGDNYFWKTNISRIDLKSVVTKSFNVDIKDFDIFSVGKQKYLNFLDDLYRKVGDQPIHPKLQDRIGQYFDHLEVGKANVGRELFNRGGMFPGEHAEIRALNELLWKIDPNNKLGNSIFANIFGVNRNIKSKLDMTRCFHCWNITDLVKILFVD